MVLKTAAVAVVLSGVLLTAPWAQPLAQVRLDLDPTDLWDADRGIHANPEERGKRWERPALLEFAAFGAAMLRTRVGVRIHGGRSRALDQKSFRVYFDHGDGPVDHDLFGGAPTRFARAILRSSQTPDRCLHTHVAEGLFQDLGHLGSRIRPVTLTLNGEPWGIYSLRERLDDEFVTVTLGHRGAFDLIRDGETRHGRGQAWWTFLDQVARPADRTSPAWLDRVESQLDLASYLDWLIINAVGATADNGGAHNLALLRLDGGPWRFIMWDEDDLFRPENLHNDHWRWLAAADAAEFQRFRPPLLITGDWTTRAPWSRLFRGLLENPVFRERFFARAHELLGGELSVARMTARINAEAARLAPAVAEHAERWGWRGSEDLHDQVTAMVVWYEVRHRVVTAQLEAFRRHTQAPASP